MKEKPILFNGDMVRAVLAGKKTQTRRVIKPQPEAPWWAHPQSRIEKWIELDTTTGIQWRPNWILTDIHHLLGDWYKSPYGGSGDQLWVRETWAEKSGKLAPYKSNVQYRADGEDLEWALKWKPSIFMPRWASRIQLEITKIRVERIQDISVEDIMAEGVAVPPAGVVAGGTIGDFRPWIHLWDSINKKRGFGWDENPWNWVVDFKMIKDT